MTSLIAASGARQFLASLFEAAVDAADPVNAISAHLPPRPKGRVVVVGAGKGSAQMARALENLWDGPLSGAVVTRYGFACETKYIKILEAAHPVPDQAGLEAARKLFSLVRELEEDDLVIALICGGGSALLPAPAGGLSLADEAEVNARLLASGAPISAMNIVRKHISSIKGGRLAAATKARVVTLIVSDIPGDNPAFVASGPTIPDRSTRHDALDAIRQYQLALPDSVMAHLRSESMPAPSVFDPVFARHEHHIIASAGVSLRAAANLAKSRGVSAAILSDSIEGEARDVGSTLAAIARQIGDQDQPFSKPVVLLSGGETTVSVASSGGRGGRNSEFALAMAIAIDGAQDIHVLAADTDGIDGTEANAGVYADGTTGARMRRAGLKPNDLLRAHDSYTGFEAIGDLFETGPTGTNVNDFRAILISNGERCWR